MSLTEPEPNLAGDDSLSELMMTGLEKDATWRGEGWYRVSGGHVHTPGILKDPPPSIVTPLSRTATPNKG